MTQSAPFLSPSEAAKRLGISAKALRLYEQRGLIAPVRTEAGWRTYGPDEIDRAAEIVSLRALGLSLAQVAQVLRGDVQSLAPALAAQESVLEGQARRIAGMIAKVRGLRSNLGRGQAPSVGELAGLVRPADELAVEFDLPWPWGGEAFVLRDIRALNFIVGPLGSGKTRLARKIAATLPAAGFLDMDRAADDGAAAKARCAADPALNARVDQALAWLGEEGASMSAALLTLVVALEAVDPAVLVVDMVEQGLDQATQEALIAYLRRRGAGARKLFLLTRSSAILDLAAMGPDEAIILCPANHSPPTLVAPYPGAPGYEAVATCLAAPEVRARTAGVIAWRPQVA